MVTTVVPSQHRRQGHSGALLQAATTCQYHIQCDPCHVCRVKPTRPGGNAPPPRRPFWQSCMSCAHLYDGWLDTRLLYLLIACVSLKGLLPLSRGHATHAKRDALSWKFMGISTSAWKLSRIRWPMLRVPNGYSWRRCTGTETVHVCSLGGAGPGARTIVKWPSSCNFERNSLQHRARRDLRGT
jgi:hypothetical protein